MFTQPMRALRATALIIALSALSLSAAGCGDDTDSSAMDMPDEDHAAESGDGDEEDRATFAFGEPGDPDDATETIEVSMLDTLAYDPPSITVPVGETVVFEVTNDGAIPHEFVLGDHELQLEHEEEMSEMDGDMETHDEPNAVLVDPGETKDLAFTFTEAGSLEYGCHEPGHYDGGMVGELVVE